MGGTPLCVLTSLLPRPQEQDANYLFKKESEDQSLTQLPASRRLAHPFHPPHFPPSPPAAPAPASTQLAFSSRGSGELFGSPGRAAEAMEASAGNDRDPGDLWAHCPAALASVQSAKYRMGEGRRGQQGEADRALGRQPEPQAFRLRRPSCQRPWARLPGSPRPRSPAPVCLFPPPPQVADQGQAAAAVTAEALRQARVEWCEPAGLRRASGLR